MHQNYETKYINKEIGFTTANTTSSNCKLLSIFLLYKFKSWCNLDIKSIQSIQAFCKQAQIHL